MYEFEHPLWTCRLREEDSFSGGLLEAEQVWEVPHLVAYLGFKVKVEVEKFGPDHHLKAEDELNDVPLNALIA